MATQQQSVGDWTAFLKLVASDRAKARAVACSLVDRSAQNILGISPDHAPGSPLVDIEANASLEGLKLFLGDDDTVELELIPSLFDAGTGSVEEEAKQQLMGPRIEVDLVNFLGELALPRENGAVGEINAHNLLASCETDPYDLADAILNGKAAQSVHEASLASWKGAWEDLENPKNRLRQLLVTQWLQLLSGSSRSLRCGCADFVLQYVLPFLVRQPLNDDSFDNRLQNLGELAHQAMKSATMLTYPHNKFVAAVAGLQLTEDSMDPVHKALGAQLELDMAHAYYINKPEENTG